MDNGCTSEHENIYFRCRKEAAMHNQKLSSREGAAELLGISVSSLQKYELGVTKTVPVDMVVLMADLYNAPELRSLYCKSECPIGKAMNIATEIKSVESVAIRLIRKLSMREVEDIKEKLLDIADDGTIGEEKRTVLQDVMSRFSSLQESISELMLLGEKYGGLRD